MSGPHDNNRCSTCGQTGEFPHARDCRFNPAKLKKEDSSPYDSRVSRCPNKSDGLHRWTGDKCANCAVQLSALLRDAFRPTGHCSCAGKGRCAWCVGLQEAVHGKDAGVITGGFDPGEFPSPEVSRRSCPVCAKHHPPDPPCHGTLDTEMDGYPLSDRLLDEAERYTLECLADSRQGSPFNPRFLLAAIKELRERRTSQVKLAEQWDSALDACVLLCESRAVMIDAALAGTIPTALSRERLEGGRADIAEIADEIDKLRTKAATTIYGPPCTHSMQSWAKNAWGSMMCGDCGSVIVQKDNGRWYPVVRETSEPECGSG